MTFVFVGRLSLNIILNYINVGSCSNIGGGVAGFGFYEDTSGLSTPIYAITYVEYIPYIVHV